MISTFYNDAFDIFDRLGPDLIDDAIDSVLPPDFTDLLGGFPPF